MPKVPKQVKLSREQADFLQYITEESSPQKALDRFADIMFEEGLGVEDITTYLDKIIKNWAKKYG